MCIVCTSLDPDPPHHAEFLQAALSRGLSLLRQANVLVAAHAPCFVGGFFAINGYKTVLTAAATAAAAAAAGLDQGVAGQGRRSREEKQQHLTPPSRKPSFKYKRLFSSVTREIKGVINSKNQTG